MTGAIAGTIAGSIAPGPGNGIGAGVGALGGAVVGFVGGFVGGIFSEDEVSAAGNGVTIGMVAGPLGGAGAAGYTIWNTSQLAQMTRIGQINNYLSTARALEAYVPHIVNDAAKRQALCEAAMLRNEAWKLGYRPVN